MDTSTTTPFVPCDGEPAGTEEVTAPRALRRLGAVSAVLLGCAAGCALVSGWTGKLDVTEGVDGSPTSLVAAPMATGLRLAHHSHGACGRGGRQFPGISKLEIIGGPAPPTRQQDWVVRLCTPNNTGTRCSVAVTWEGMVTLCIDGVAIPDVRLKTRGHVSTFFPKHQFSIKLPKARSLLGMPAAKRWVLATSFIDTSFQRNPTAFELYQKLGGWAAHQEYVTVNWHGTDFGLYYVGEKIERGHGRLSLPKAKGQHPAKSGYLLTVDWPKDGSVVVQSPNTSTYFSILYPKKKDVSPLQQQFLQRLVNRVDNLAASPFEGPELEAFVDFPSFARFFVIEELANDFDGYAFSVFLEVKQGKLFHATPWDFDLAFGFVCNPQMWTNIFTNHSETSCARGWNVENVRNKAPWFGPSGLPNTGWKSFGSNRRQFFLNVWTHTNFRKSFARYWHRARQGPLSDSAMTTMVERRSQAIAPAAEYDLTIWAKTDRCAYWNCCKPEAAQDFQVASQYLSWYLVSRAKWIDANVDKY